MKDLLKSRSFVFIWLGQATSAIAGTFAVFVLSWLVYEMTGSKVIMGSMWVAYMLPTLIIQIFSGPYVDRWDRKKIMVFCEWSRAGAFLVVLILFMTGVLEMWHLYSLAITMGIVEPLFRPSSMAYVAQILPQDRLVKGNSFLEGTMQIMMLIGPALGGLLLTLFGVELILFLLVLFLTVAGILLSFLPKSEQETVEGRPSWLTEFKAGISFYYTYPVLFFVGMMLLFINMCNGAAVPMFLPFVSETLSGTAFQYGLFTSAFSLGMILGSLFTATAKEPKDRRKVMLGVTFLQGLLYVFLGLNSLYALALLIVLSQGVCAIIFNIHNTTFYQQRVPAHLRGRVFTVRILMATAGSPIGAMFGGVVAEQFSIPILFMAIGVFITLISLIAFRLRVFHHLNDGPLKEAEIVVSEQSGVQA